MATVFVQPAGEDRLVPVPGRRKQYFPHGVWTEAERDFALDRLIAAGDLTVRPADEQEDGRA